MSDYYTAGLRELADFLDSHPDLLAKVNYAGVGIDAFADDQESFAVLGRSLGTSEKCVAAAWLMLRRRFGPHRLDVNLPRSSACIQVQVGEEEIEEVVPVGAVPADAEVIDRETHARIRRTVPKYEWKCPPSFLEASEGKL